MLSIICESNITLPLISFSMLNFKDVCFLLVTIRNIEVQIRNIGDSIRNFEDSISNIEEIDCLK